MKKLTILVSALALLLYLCACSGQAGGTTQGTDVPSEPGATSQPVSGTTSQDMEHDAEPPAAPTEETKTPEPSEEDQPPAVDSEISDPPPTSTSVPEPDAPPVPPPAPEITPDPPSAPDPVPAADPKAVAQTLIGHPVSELYAAIGQPISSDYVRGCVEPDSEDGELVYNGFTVYTVRTASREYVFDVL